MSQCDNSDYSDTCFFFSHSPIVSSPSEQTVTNFSFLLLRSKICKTASKQLTGLHELKVWVQVHDSAPKFSLREKWLQPLLQFRRLTSQQPRKHDNDDAVASFRPVTLEAVEIHILTRWSRDALAMCLNNHRLAQASTELHVLYGHAVSLAIRGAKEEEAMAAFNATWKGKYKCWNHHLQFARTGW